MTPVASVRNLFVVVLAIALDCYLIQYCLVGGPYIPYANCPSGFRIVFIGSLPTADAVVIGGFMTLSRRGAGRPFLTGFVLSGAGALFGMLGLAFVLPEDVFRPLDQFLFDISRRVWITFNPSMFYIGFLFAIEFAIITAVFTIPELLIAVRGGLLARSLSQSRADSAKVIAAERNPMIG